MPFSTAESKKEYNKAYYQANKCEHNKRKSRCVECGGSQICEHKKLRGRCVECGGSEICEHKKLRGRCVECGGSQICEHSKVKQFCKECGGRQICEHNKQKNGCIECGGNRICEHNKRKSYCKDCGGSQICEHNKIRNRCIECKGSQICEHGKHKQRCKECLPPNEYLVLLQRESLRRIMKSIDIEKTKPSIEYLGCSAEYFKEYIEKKMKETMTWNNIHLDHIKPVSKFNLKNMTELLDCCHYSNFQPLLAFDNISKSNKWNEEDELFWNENIKGKEHLELYFPK